MHLKSISLHGFKTFAGRTTLELRPGITAIVGPNGSGKSNITDAVRWALGETNLRHVRCRSTDELIFAGNARRSSLGLAEVSLVFANEGGWLGVPFNEVRVTRRAYRSGENEYLLNGTRVRLRDIVDLLAGASIHAGGHVVINQGLVDAVLSLRPEERRATIENLAGLKQYYLRRDEAESKLAQTEANLVHVDVVVAELAPQLESLSQQAQVLRAYRAAEAELRQLQQVTYGAQAARLLSRLKSAEPRVAETQDQLAAAQAAVIRNRQAEETLLSTLEVDRATREPLRGRVAAEQALVAAAKRDQAVASAQITAAEERAGFLHAEHDHLAEAACQEQQALQEASLAVDSLHTEIREIEAQIAMRRAGARSLQSERDRAAVADRDAQARYQDALRRVTRLAEATAASAASVESLSREIERHKGALASAQASLHEAETEHAAAVMALAAAQQHQAEARTAEHAARARAGAARQVVAATQSELQAAIRERERIAARHEVLQSWLHNLDGLDAPLRDLAQHGGAVGVVAHSLHIDPAWQMPIASLLGARFVALVTDDLDALLMERLRGDSQRGRVTIIATSSGCRELGIAGFKTGAPELAVTAGSGIPDGSQARLGRAYSSRHERGGDGYGDAQGRPCSDELAPNLRLPTPGEALAALRTLGVIGAGDELGWASQKCEDCAGIPVCAALQLDRVILLRDAATLLRCQPFLPAYGLSAVAQDSALAALADGSVVCGIDERAAELIRRRQELNVLQVTLDEARGAEKRARERLAREQAVLSAAETEHERERKALSTADSGASRARDEARFHERLVLEARRTASAALPLTERLATDFSDKRALLEAEQLQLAAARDESDSLGQASGACQLALNGAVERVAGAQAICRDAELMAARLHDRLTSAIKLVDERQRHVTNIERDVARHAEQERSMTASVAALDRARREAVAREAAAAKSLSAIEAELRPLEARIHDEEGRYAELRAAVHLAGESLALAQSAYDTARRDLDSVSRETEILRAQVASELGCELEELPVAVPPHGAIGRVKALRAELSAIGPVNARAEDDLTGVEDRLGFLRTQATDLREGVARLRSIIEEANSTLRERFTATVAQLDAQFAVYFSRLFGGGSCRLTAEYDAVGMPVGVEVSAQPPGKRTRDLALLSGGERALVALALLFAMLRVRPVPFCLLDEVEAALDESNTGRFGSILKELSATTQFLLVTHNRGTMLHADRLFGVTMSEAGISITASLETAAASSVSSEPAAPTGTG